MIDVTSRFVKGSCRWERKPWTVDAKPAWGAANDAQLVKMVSDIQQALRGNSEAYWLLLNAYAPTLSPISPR